MIYDRHKYLLTQRGTGNVGNVGGNAELCREGAAHNTTKSKTRVGQDLLACPLTDILTFEINLVYSYSPPLEASLLLSPSTALS